MTLKGWKESLLVKLSFSVKIGANTTPVKIAILIKSIEVSS